MSSTVSVLPSPSIQMARSLPCPVEDLAAMSPFDLFQRQMESGSTEAAVDAMKRTSVVAVAMGRTEAVKELVPYLTSVAMQQPPHADELLLILGQQLIAVTEFCGFETADLFLPMLERLTAIEETVVRDQGVAVITHVCDLVIRNKGQGTVDKAAWVGLAKRLQAADWFTAKVSACGVAAPLFSLTSDEDLLTLYKELTTDETPMVRRAAAKYLGKVLAAAAWQHKELVVAALPTLIRDEQDSVRLLAVAALAEAGPSYGEHCTWTIQNWLPLLKDGCIDMSWRVRHNLAKNFSDAAINLGINSNVRYSNEQSLVMACFVSLLTDQEAEVRAAAVAHLARMVTWGGSTHFSSHLQPLLPALADDIVMEVRSKCALALMDAADGGTLEDNLILQAFGPLLENFLQDEFHEVQLQVLTNLHKIAHLLPGLAGVVTSLLQMSKAANWRVREAVAKLLPHLAEARGLDFFGTVLLEPVWMVLLLDPVASVRSAIVQGMGLLVKVAGDEWVMSQLLPQHVHLFNQDSSSYLVRMTIIQTHVEAAVVCKTGPLWNDIVVQILRGLNDKVANVRMVAAHGLARVVTEGDPAMVQSQIRPALEKRMQEDDDHDCRQACELALAQVK